MKAYSQILSFLISGVAATAFNPPPTILDTDYGSFIDDIFAVSLLIQSTDVLDPRLIITTQEQTELSAKCVWEQIQQSDLDYEIPIAIGETLPPNSERAGPCANTFAKVGFALEDYCKDVVVDPDTPLIENGVEYMADMLLKSDRTDWTYIAIGGQTSLAKLIRDYPDAAEKIETLFIMGGNWCTGFEPYPGVPAPVQETNVACDPRAANYVLNGDNLVFPNVYYGPVVTAAALGGDDYSLITTAASNGHKAANATIEFYKAWSDAARADPELLVNAEALAYDPATQSTPQFDAVNILAAMDIIRGKNRVALETFSNGVHFVTNEEEAAGDFAPALAAQSLWSGDENFAMYGINNTISNKCTAITNLTFDPATLTENPVPVKAALGFVSDCAEQDFFLEMAQRMAGSSSCVDAEVFPWKGKEKTCKKFVKKQIEKRGKKKACKKFGDFCPVMCDKCGNGIVL